MEIDVGRSIVMGNKMLKTKTDCGKKIKKKCDCSQFFLIRHRQRGLGRQRNKTEVSGVRGLSLPRAAPLKDPRAGEEREGKREIQNSSSFIKAF